MLVRLTLIEEIERINVIVIRNSLQRQGKRREGMKRNSYMIEVDKGRNCYSYRRFGYLVSNCRN